MSSATLANLRRRMADKFGPFVGYLQAMAADEASGVKHLDETGLKVDRNLHWMHVVATHLLTVYRLGRRGDVPTRIKGYAVHDSLISYFKLDSFKHCLCNCHHLRELEAVAKLDGESWAQEMQDLLLEMLAAVNAVLEKGNKAVDEATLSP